MPNPLQKMKHSLSDKKKEAKEKLREKKDELAERVEEKAEYIKSSEFRTDISDHSKKTLSSAIKKGADALETQNQKRTKQFFTEKGSNIGGSAGKNGAGYASTTILTTIGGGIPGAIVSKATTPFVEKAGEHLGEKAGQELGKGVGARVRNTISVQLTNQDTPDRIANGVVDGAEKMVSGSTSRLKKLHQKIRTQQEQIPPRT